MVNIVITAGGTSEHIDSVRKITNSSSGKLGSIIAEELAKKNNIDTIFYIKAKKAVVPNISASKLKVIEIESTLDVKKAVEDVLTNNKIDYFIHSMAISDYYVDYVSTAEMIADDIDKGRQSLNAIKNPIHKIDNTKKISSNQDNLVVMLKPTPKIIGLIKELSPNTILIGFKLLDNVYQEHLIRVARELMEKNSCDYVIANDLSQINATKHKAFIISKNSSIETAETKQEIAKIISNKIK